MTTYRYNMADAVTKLLEDAFDRRDFDTSAIYPWEQGSIEGYQAALNSPQVQGLVAFTEVAVRCLEAVATKHIAAQGRKALADFKELEVKDDQR